MKESLLFQLLPNAAFKRVVKELLYQSLMPNKCQRAIHKTKVVQIIASTGIGFFVNRVTIQADAESKAAMEKPKTKPLMRSSHQWILVKFGMFK